jgi:hypothetical protein
MLNQTLLSKMTPADRLRTMLESPQEWPNPLYLPVKKGKFPNQQLGIVIYYDGQLVIWRNANLFLPPTTWKDKSHVTISDIVNENWEVD